MSECVHKCMYLGSYYPAGICLVRLRKFRGRCTSLYTRIGLNSFVRCTLNHICSPCQSNGRVLSRPELLHDDPDPHKYGYLDNNLPCSFRRKIQRCTDRIRTHVCLVARNPSSPHSPDRPSLCSICMSHWRCRRRDCYTCSDKRDYHRPLRSNRDRISRSGRPGRRRGQRSRTGN